MIRLREELSEQIRSLKELKEMASRYGYDISGPARNAREAVQWTYFGYLAAIKQQNGAAMSAGRLSTFWDIYFERDLREGTLTEAQAQEIIDDLVIKWRIVRFLRAPEYNAALLRRPGVGDRGGRRHGRGRPHARHQERVPHAAHALNNLGPAPEPNLTVFWSPRLPDGFKRFAIKASIDTSAIQYESDDLMRPKWGDDCAIACCVSAMRVGKQMQFFGARVNLPKTLLYALNGGRDEVSGEQIGPKLAPITGDVLDYDEVMERLDPMLDWLAKTYVNALNVIHYMHDKYCYEAIEMALHDRDVLRTLACGIAGLSHAADSLSAIKYAKVKPVRDERGLIVDFKTEGEFPCFGNNDDRADDIAKMLVSMMMNKIRDVPDLSQRGAHAVGAHDHVQRRLRQGDRHHARRPQEGRGVRARREPVERPRHARRAGGADVGREDPVRRCRGRHFAHAVGGALRARQRGRATRARRAARSTRISRSGGFHVNINVLNRETLQDAMKHPDKYPQLTIRVSGYAVNFVKLTKEQQLDVINRTFHGCDVGGEAP